MSWPEDLNSDVESETTLLSPHALDEEQLLAGSFSKTSQKSETWPRYVYRCLFFLNVIWTLVLVVATGICFMPQKGVAGLNGALRKVSTPSPLFDSIPLGPSKHTVSGTLHDDGSIYRQPPSPEVDAAWHDIALHEAQLINVTAADILASGKDPTNRVRWSEDEDSYPAQVEFSHKIHCLDEIRKEIWGEHYFGEYSIHADDEGFSDDEEANLHAERRKHRGHAMHCLHIILQDLTCSVDVGIVTHEWIKVPSRPDDDLVPMADFSTEKQCRDYDKAAEWVRDHAVEDGLDKFATLRNANKDMASDSDDNYW